MMAGLGWAGLLLIALAVGRSAPQVQDAMDQGSRNVLFYDPQQAQSSQQDQEPSNPSSPPVNQLYNSGFRCYSKAELDKMKTDIETEVRAKFENEIERIKSATNQACRNEVAKVEVEITKKVEKMGNVPYCNVHQITVTEDQKTEIKENILTSLSVKEHIGSVADLEWRKISQSYFADIDGRSHERVLGTLGGDMGEFILVLESFRRIKYSGFELSQEQVTDLLDRFLASTQKNKFYMSTDATAVNHVISSLGISEAALSNPPEDLKAKLLDVVTTAEGMGCQHLKNMLSDPAGYQVNQNTVKHSIAAFHQIMWNKTNPVSKKLLYVKHEGQHDEKGLLNIVTDSTCLDGDLAPALSTRPGEGASCVGTMFIHHPDAVSVLRKELASFFATGDADAKGLSTSVYKTANHQGFKLFATKGHAYLNGYPIFTANLIAKEA